MRIVAVADTHLFEQELGFLPTGDVFVHAGDLLRTGTLDELRQVARWLRELPHPYKIVVAGNHDWCFQREPEAAAQVLGSGISYLQDSPAVVGGVRFFGSPWQPAFNDWAFNLPRGEALREKWHEIPADVQVLVTHAAPAGLGDQSPIGGRAGCQDLRDAVRRLKPCLHLFGHIHQDGGFWQDGPTSYANVTTWECERGPTIVDLDPDTLSVTAVEVPPARRRSG